MTKLSDLVALTLPAAADEFYVRDESVAASAESKKITHDDLLFGASGTPSTQAHSDSAAKGSALDAARSDHKHAMPAEGSGPGQADQAALEAETNENTYAPPDLIRHSPGVCKAYCTVAGDGTLQSNSYNITSTAKDSTGRYTVTFDDDFANTHGAFVAMVEGNSPAHAALRGDSAWTTDVDVETWNTTHATEALQDNAFGMAGFGDQ
jgi:hypothetical protein